MENMMSCLRNDDTFSICKDSAKFSSSAGVLVFSSARCIVVSRSVSLVLSHWEFGIEDVGIEVRAGEISLSKREVVAEMAMLRNVGPPGSRRPGYPLTHRAD